DRELVLVGRPVEVLEEHLVRAESALERALRLGQFLQGEIGRKRRIGHWCSVLQLADHRVRAGGRVPASSRITSPFKSGFSTMKRTTRANSSARPARRGNSASASSSVTKSSGRKPTIGVAMKPGATPMQRMPYCDRSRVHTSVRPASPALAAV